ncbi:hypothetical protein JW698_02840 [Candidatus Wolfebacteria bacterium]|nr:hypothetical protein [Candidatus Wolfebacteria bacterium]
MSTVIIPKKELKKAIEESVREVFKQELMKFRSLFLSFVSQQEQKDIEKRYGKPSRKTAKSLEIKLWPVK